MPRRAPANRFPKLIAAATKTFVRRGYRLTQMSDVASELGVGKGTLYSYVTSKEQLFDAAVRYADGQQPLPSQFPLLAAPDTRRYVAERLAQEASALEAARVLALPKRSRVAPDELERVIRDLFERMWRNRRALKLVERCAGDILELDDAWSEHRWKYVTLIANYLQKRMASGHVRSMPDPLLASRMLLEFLSLWAIHEPWEATSGGPSREKLEAVVVDMLVHAYGVGR